MRNDETAVAVLSGHLDAVTTVAFGVDGRTLVTGARDGVAIRWDVADPAEPRRLGSAGVPSPRRRWRRRDPRPVGVSRDGRLLAIGGEPVRIWNVADPGDPVPVAVLAAPRRSRYNGHAVGFSPDARLLAVGGTDAVTLWDVSDLARPVPVARLRTHRWGYRSPVHAVAFSPDGRLLACDGGPALVGFDVTDPGNASRVLRAKAFPKSASSLAAAYALTFRPDGRLLATASFSQNGGQYGSSEQSAVLVWDLADPARAVRTVAHIHQHTYQMSLRPRRGATPAADPAGHVGTVRAVGFGPDGRWQATGGDDRTARLWDLADPAHPRVAAVFPHTSAVLAVAVSPDGRLLATGTAGATAALWQVGPDDLGVL